jgi:hypothetical protein
LEVLWTSSIGGQVQHQSKPATSFFLFLFLFFCFHSCGRVFIHNLDEIFNPSIFIHLVNEHWLVTRHVCWLLNNILGIVHQTFWNPIIKQILDNLTLETRHQIIIFRLIFILTMDFFGNSYLPHMASDWNDFYIIGFLLRKSTSLQVCRHFGDYKFWRSRGYFSYFVN